MTTDPSSSSSSSSHEFRVHKVRRSKKRQPVEPLQESLRYSVGGEIESSSIVDAEVLSRIGLYHAVLGAVYTAYSLHYPLVLSPDALWITIGQGIAHHLVIHGAEWRQGNDRGTQADKTLRLKTTTNDNTSNATESWCTAIRDHVGPEWADLLTCQFSTTTQTDRTVGHVVLMDVFRRYYNEERISICGIPSVTLEGTVDDYKLLRQKTRKALTKLNMDWWLKDLEPILDQFVQARSGNIDSKHWKNICKHEEAYGGAIINGWIAKLFPYLRSFIRGPCRDRNPAIGAPKGKHPGFSTMVAPSGLSRVLFEEEEEGDILVQKELVAGFLGVTQDPKTLALRPLTGWVVRKASKEDALVHRLIREEKQSTELVSLEEIPMDERHLLGISSTNKKGEGDYPEDLYRLHYQLKDVRVGPIRLSTPKGDVQGWSKIAEVEDGRVVVADPDVSVRDPRFPRGDSLSYDPSFCVIGVCSPKEWEVYDDCEEEEKDNNHTTLLQGVVVAYSVADWLEQSLDWAASSMHQEHSCYWDAPDYVPLGDLQNPTRYYDEKDAREKGEVKEEERQNTTRYYDEKDAREKREVKEEERNAKKKKRPGILTVLKKVLKQSYS